MAGSDAHELEDDDGPTPLAYWAAGLGEALQRPVDRTPRDPLPEPDLPLDERFWRTRGHE